MVLFRLVRDDANLVLECTTVGDELLTQSSEDGETQLLLEDGRPLGLLPHAFRMVTSTRSQAQAAPAKAAPVEVLEKNCGI